MDELGNGVGQAKFLALSNASVVALGSMTASAGAPPPGRLFPASLFKGSALPYQCLLAHRAALILHRTDRP